MSLKLISCRQFLPSAVYHALSTEWCVLSAWNRLALGCLCLQEEIQGCSYGPQALHQLPPHAVSRLSSYQPPFTPAILRSFSMLSDRLWFFLLCPALLHLESILPFFFSPPPPPSKPVFWGLLCPSHRLAPPTTFSHVRNIPSICILAIA